MDQCSLERMWQHWSWNFTAWQAGSQPLFLSSTLSCMCKTVFCDLKVMELWCITWEEVCYSKLFNHWKNRLWEEAVIAKLPQGGKVCLSRNMRLLTHSSLSFPLQCASSQLIPRSAAIVKPTSRMIDPWFKYTCNLKKQTKQFLSSCYYETVSSST